MYEAIRNNEVDVICAFATDGRIAAYNLKPLKDDRNFFPPYHAAPVIREEILKAQPRLGDVLSLFGGVIDNATMQRLNFEVDGKKRRTAEVVEEFLKAKGIL
jgi:glycine betaine/choline ABC-type transport system substrate-binding protein